MENKICLGVPRQPINHLPIKSRPQVQLNNIKKLGGIFLYNQNFKRYLSSQSVDHNKAKKGCVPSQAYKQEQEDEIIQRQIKDFIEHRESYHFNVSSAFTSELENIIQTLKHSHVSTNRFLQEHQHYNQSINKHAVFSFQELFQSQKNKSKNKESRLVRTLLRQFNKAIMQEIQKIKDEEDERKRIRESLKRQASVQTTNYHENEMTYLRKELERREVQYNALYNYKKDMLNQGENIIKNHEINLQLQKALITKLENQVASRNLEVKNLRTQLKVNQDKLVAKMLELQRIYTISQARSSLSSIQESINSNDVVKQNEVITNFISKINNKKNRIKKRAQSILSITHSLFSNKKDKDDLVGSSLDFNAESLRETNVHFDKEFDDQFIEILKKASKKSANNLFKILEIYEKNKNKSEKNYKKLKNMGNNMRSNPYSKSKVSSKLESEYQKQSSRREETESMVSKEREERIEELPSEQNISFIEEEAITSKANKLKRQLSFEKSLPDRENKKIECQNAQDKNSILKSSFKDLSVIEQNGNYFTSKSNRNKCKKGVSFQIINEEEIVNLDFHSQVVSICIRGSKRENEAQQTESLVNEKMSEPNLQIFDKLRFSKNKLVKTRLKEQTHKKVNSAFDSHTASSFAGSKNEKEIKSQNKFASTSYQLSHFANQKQRFSYHNSQERILNSHDSSKQRNSFSRFQRPSTNLNSTNCQSENEREAKTAKQMALKSKSRQQFHERLMVLHKGCKQDCQHIRKYLQFFDKCKQYPRNQFKLKIENLNSHIQQKNLPLLGKAK